MVAKHHILIQLVFVLICPPLLNNFSFFICGDGGQTSQKKMEEVNERLNRIEEFILKTHGVNLKETARPSTRPTLGFVELPLTQEELETILKDIAHKVVEKEGRGVSLPERVCNGDYVQMIHDILEEINETSEMRFDFFIDFSLFTGYVYGKKWFSDEFIKTRLERTIYSIQIDYDTKKPDWSDRHPVPYQVFYNRFKPRVEEILADLSEKSPNLEFYLAPPYLQVRRKTIVTPTLEECADRAAELISAERAASSNQEVNTIQTQLRDAFLTFAKDV